MVHTTLLRSGGKQSGQGPGPGLVGLQLPLELVPFTQPSIIASNFKYVPLVSAVRLEVVAVEPAEITGTPPRSTMPALASTSSSVTAIIGPAVRALPAVWRPARAPKAFSGAGCTHWCVHGDALSMRPLWNACPHPPAARAAGSSTPRSSHGARCAGEHSLTR